MTNFYYQKITNVNYRYVKKKNIKVEKSKEGNKQIGKRKKHNRNKENLANIHCEVKAHLDIHISTRNCKALVILWYGKWKGHITYISTNY